MKKIGIVIVSYNSEKIIRNCVIAAKKSSSNNNQTLIVVVDNNSKDNSVVVSKKAGADVITNNKNLGFAKAVNQGLKHLLEKDCEYYLILNPDAILEKSCIDKMLNRIDSDTGIGAVGPKMIHGDGTDASGGYYLKTPGFLSVLLFSTLLRPFFIKSERLVRAVYEEAPLFDNKNVAQIPGACLMTTKKALKNIGLLDEDFAIWFEDVEWSYRARKNGYKLVYCEGARVVHEGGVTFLGWDSPDKAVTFYVSMKTFFKKNKPIQQPFVLIVLSINAFFSFIKSKDKNQFKFIRSLWVQKKGVLPD